MVLSRLYNTIHLRETTGASQDGARPHTAHGRHTVKVTHSGCEPHVSPSAAAQACVRLRSAFASLAFRRRARAPIFATRAYNYNIVAISCHVGITAEYMGISPVLPFMHMCIFGRCRRRRKRRGVHQIWQVPRSASAPSGRKAPEAH